MLFALGALWSIAVPLFAAPDEPSHTVRAVSVARGQLGGQEHTPPGRPTVTDVRVPEVFASAHSVPACFLHTPGLTAACAPPLSSSRRLVPTGTFMGRYPPAYYFVVGLPSRWAVSAFGVYLIRLVSAAATAALLASALSTVRRERTGRMAAGLALALTPMLFFLAGSVNPNGLEVAAGVGLWVALLALHREPGGPDRRVLAVRAAVAGSVLANSRPLGPLWLMAIVAFVAAGTGRRQLRSLVKDTAVRHAAVVTAAFTAAAVAWNVTRHSYDGYGTDRGPQLSTVRFVQESAGRTWDRLLQAVGVFGWTDTRAPLLTYALWVAGVGAVVALAVSGRDRRRLVALAGLAAAVVVVPVAGETSKHIGFFWLGRYTLPLAVGVPLLAADAAGPAMRGVVTRLRLWVGALAAAHVLAFAWAVRRFTLGAPGLGSPRWAPPVPAPVLVTAFALVAGLYWLRLTTGRASTPGGVNEELQSRSWTRSFPSPDPSASRSSARDSPVSLCSSFMEQAGRPPSP